MNAMSASRLHRYWCRLVPAVLAMAVMPSLWSCSGEQAPYPDLVTEMADIQTDHAGRLRDIIIDDGTRYAITNTDIRPHRPDTVYRAVVGFVPEAPSASAMPGARIYTLTGACVLADSTTVARHDPTGIESMWAAGSYINMQLTAKSQGGLHYWGYAVDSLAMADGTYRRHACHYLSVHHVQGADPLSYSATYYCSIAVPAIPDYHSGDTVTVTIHTFGGPKVWTFRPQ